MLMDSSRSLVLLVDVQEKLTPLVQDAKALVEACLWVKQVAAQLGIPVLITEQYPKGLGHTVPELSDQTRSPEKTHFSCMADTSIQKHIGDYERDQLILVGIEAHVCVMQTALQAKEQGFDVFVVADAISSRFALDKELALARMQQQGIVIVSREMLLFEWIRTSQHPDFKALSKAFLRTSK